MAFYTVFVISAIVGSVISLVDLCGWELGVSESIASVIVVGFAVDYVVHIASHYTHSHKKDRHSRIEESL
jgi:predicted RND superfamily exporter protein